LSYRSIVGRPHRTVDLDRLRLLIEQYTDEARQILAGIEGRP
jgi:hypothetical protein